jgi:hypothetical protein
MNKKKSGEASMATFIGILLLLLFLTVILTSFFCPDCLAPGVAAGAERISDSVLGELRKKAFDKEVLQAPEQVQETFDNIVAVLRSDWANEGACIFEHEPFADNFRDHRIELSRTGDDTFIELKNKKGQSIDRENIEGRVPCVVGGKEAADNFYKNYLDGTICSNNCEQDTLQVDSIKFNRKKKITFTWKEGLEPKLLEDKEFIDDNLVYKHSSGQICFFQTDVNGGGCGDGFEGVDTDCFDEISDKLPRCGKLEIFNLYFQRAIDENENDADPRSISALCDKSTDCVTTTGQCVNEAQGQNPWACIDGKWDKCDSDDVCDSLTTSEDVIYYCDGSGWTRFQPPGCSGFHLFNTYVDESESDTAPGSVDAWCDEVTDCVTIFGNCIDEGHASDPWECADGKWDKCEQDDVCDSIDVGGTPYYCQGSRWVASVPNNCP